MDARTTTFAALLRRRRLEAGLSQQELADRAGLSRRGISSLERDPTRLPRRDTVERLVEALHLAGAERAAFEAAARAGMIPMAPWGGHASPAGSGDRLPIDWGARRQPPLVGREREIAAVDRLLRGDGPPMLTLAGDPGIGKSRLLHEARVRATAMGWSVLRAGCARQGIQEPYAPMLFALAERLRGWSRRQLRAHLDGCAWLARLLPELAESGLAPPPPRPPEQERRLMFAAVARFLANVAGPAGTLLLLDDLQWAGQDGLDLLGTLVRMAPVGLRVIGAYRGTEVPRRHPLALLLGDLTHDELVAQLTLGPLARGEARDLLAGLLADLPEVAGERERAALEDRMLRRAGGVPFYLVSLARAALSQRDDEGTGDGDEPARPAAAATERVPWEVAQSIRQRVALLPEGAAELLAVAAVGGRAIEHATVEAVAARLGHEPYATLRALEAALASRLLLEQGEVAYGVAHDLIREAVLADLGASRRRTLHRLVAEALEAGLAEEGRRRRAGELAWHYRQAGEAERALGYALRAGDHAEALYAHADAERHYRVALELALERADRAREAEARLKLGQICVILARHSEATALLEGALEAFGSIGDAAGQAWAAQHLGLMYVTATTTAQGILRLEDLLARLPPDASPGSVAPVYAMLASCYWLEARYREELAAAERAIELARTAGEPLILAQAELYYAAAQLMLGRVGEAGETLQRILPMLRGCNDPNQEGYALENLVMVYEAQGALTAAQRCIEESIALGERAGSIADGERVGYIAPIVWVLFRRAQCAYYVGDWAGARIHLERAIAAWGDAAAPPQARYPLFWLGRLLRLQGQEEASEGYHRRAMGFYEAEPPLRYDWLIVAPLAEDDLLAGAPEFACARVQAYLDRLAEPDCLDAIPLAAPLAEALLALGREAEAEETVSAAIARARRAPHRLALVDLLRVQALVAARHASWEEGEAAAAEAVLLARELPYPYAEARALYAHGLLDAAHGAPERARAHLEAARAILNRLGERPYAALVERALAQAERPATG